MKGRLNAPIAIWIAIGIFGMAFALDALGHTRAALFVLIGLSAMLILRLNRSLSIQKDLRELLDIQIERIEKLRGIAK